MKVCFLTQHALGPASLTGLSRQTCHELAFTTKDENLFPLAPTPDARRPYFQVRQGVVMHQLVGMREMRRMGEMREMQEIAKIGEIEEIGEKLLPYLLRLPHLPYLPHLLRLPHLPHLPHLHCWQKDQLLMTTPGET